MTEGGIVYSICQCVKEFTSGPNEDLIYKGREVHTVDVSLDERWMPRHNFGFSLKPGIFN
jgi:hypothetical protein